MADYSNWSEHRQVSVFYGDRRGRRSGVLLMNHINEGLVILEYIEAAEETKAAWMLHPLVQEDHILAQHWLDVVANNEIKSLALALEYRNIANQYLSWRQIESVREIALSPLVAVNHMLIADKVQNRKDFLLYQKEHPRYKELDQYFKNWMIRLGIDDDKYAELAALIS